MNRLLGSTVLAALLSMSASCAGAQELVEAWRSIPYPTRSVSVNCADGSVWTASGDSVLRFAADGTELLRLSGFSEPSAVSVNFAEGSCWVADTGAGEVCLLAPNGRELWRGHGFAVPQSLSVNQSDGSCWVADSGHGEVVHLGPDGTELRRVGDIGLPTSVSVNSADGSCWVADRDRGHVIHISVSGQVRRWSGFPGVTQVSVNPVDGTCWANRTYYAYGLVPRESVVRVTPDGQVVTQVGGFEEVRYIATDPSNGSCLVVADFGARVVRVSVDGVWLWERDDLDTVHGLAVDSVSGSCWVGGTFITNLNAYGAVLWQAVSFRDPTDVSVDPNDGSCWVVDSDSRQVVRLSADGSMLWHRELEGGPYSVSVNADDRSAWVVAPSNGLPHTLHLAADGSTLLLDTGHYGYWVAVNSTDGSCWIDGTCLLAADGTVRWESDEAGGVVSPDPTDGSCWIGVQHTGYPGVADAELIYRARDGRDIWRQKIFESIRDVSVNSADRSVWIAVTPEEGAYSEVQHRSAHGSVLWQGTVSDFPWDEKVSVSVNPKDGSCWVGVADGQLVHIAANGAVLHRTEAALYWPRVEASPYDGSCWVAGKELGHAERGWVVRLALATSRFPDVPFSHWAYKDIEACVSAGIVAGYDDGLYRPGTTVTRAQMAVYITRAMAGGDAAVPDPGCTTPPFPDVSCDYWARKYIQYALVGGVVQGYADGYHPEEAVNRGQMAAYIARALCGGEAGVPDPGCGAPVFPDVPCDFWARKHVQYIKDEEVTGGYPDGNYHPEYTVTRDQMAVFVARAFELPI